MVPDVSIEKLAKDKINELKQQKAVERMIQALSDLEIAEKRVAQIRKLIDDISAESIQTQEVVRYNEYGQPIR